MRPAPPMNPRAGRNTGPTKLAVAADDQRYELGGHRAGQRSRSTDRCRATRRPCGSPRRASRLVPDARSTERAMRASATSASMSIVVAISTSASPRRKRIVSPRCKCTPRGDQVSVSVAVPTRATAEPDREVTRRVRGQLRRRAGRRERRSRAGDEDSEDDRPQRKNDRSEQSQPIANSRRGDLVDPRLRLHRHGAGAHPGCRWPRHRRDAPRRPAGRGARRRARVPRARRCRGSGRRAASGPGRQRSSRASRRRARIQVARSRGSRARTSA